MPKKIHNFRDRVLAVVKRIPVGEVMTYGDVAFAAGSPGGARAVGSLMKQSRDPAVPCHRVVRADMRPGEYNRVGGGRTKMKRLAAEGHTFVKGRLISAGSIIKRKSTKRRAL